MDAPNPTQDHGQRIALVGRGNPDKVPRPPTAAPRIVAGAFKAAFGARAVGAAS